MSAFRPDLKPVSRFLAMLKWIKRIGLSLTVITGFTRFTAANRVNYQGIWALGHRRDTVKRIEEIKLWRQRAVAAARAEARFLQLPKREQAAFTRRYQAFVVAREPKAEAARLGISIGRGSSRLGDSYLQPDLPASAQQRETEAAIRKTETWIEYPLGGAPPTEKEVEICKQEAARAESVYRQAREALIAVLSDKLQLPVIEDPYIEPFVESLVGTTVEMSMESMIPRNIPNLAAVREWWREYRNGRTFPDERWSWNPPADKEDALVDKTESPLSAEQLITKRTEKAILLMTRKYAQADVDDPRSSRRSAPSDGEDQGSRRRSGFGAEREEQPRSIRPEPRPSIPIE